MKEQQNENMSKVSWLWLFLCFAVPAFAQGGEQRLIRRPTGSPSPQVLHGYRIRGLRTRPSQRRQRLRGLARNPAARPGIQLALILGLALIESLALFTLVIIFVKVA